MGSLLLFLLVALAVLLLVKGVEVRNQIDRLWHKKEQKKSDERIAANTYGKVLRDTFDALEMALENERTTLQDVVRDVEIGTPMFMSLSQLFPNLRHDLASAENVIRRNYDSWDQAKRNLNQAITDYNQAVSRFPDSVIASFCGYTQESLIDQYDLDASLRQEVDDRFNARRRDQLVPER